MNVSSFPPESLKKALTDATVRAAATLGEILGVKVNMHLDQIRLLDRSEFGKFLSAEVGELGTVVQIKFKGDLSGNSNFLFPGKNDQIVIDILAKQDPGFVNDAVGQEAVIIEIGNIVLNMYTGTIMNQMGTHVVYETPRILFRQEKLDAIIALDKPPTQDLHHQIVTSRLSFSGQEVTVYILEIFSEA